MSSASDELDRIVSSVQGRTDPKSLLEAVMIEWGGPAGFAQELRQEFVGLAEGHSNRIKIQTLILQALLKFGEPPDEEESLEEKEAQLKRLEEQAGEDTDDGFA